jgi:uncharacterized protein
VNSKVPAAGGLAATETDPATHVSRYILVKLAARCNLGCTYCYWFRDDSVYEKPAILTREAEAAFVAKLERHLRTNQLDGFSILFHGGEPLLFGKKRFHALCETLRALEARLGVTLDLALTTNGVLIDYAWATLLRDFQVHVTLSIDGPAPIHDATRVDLGGHGTLARVLVALRTLRDHRVEPGILAVCNPNTDPEEVCTFFTQTLGVSSFDILVPDATHEDHPPSIARYYERLFDLWYDSYLGGGVRIRYLETVTRGLFGLRSRSESVGYRPVTTLTLLTDGSLEPLDVLRISGHRSTKTSYDIFNHGLDDIRDDPLWREVWQASLTLAAPCEPCLYRTACGGGHIASRWSKANRFDNVSVYCEDIKMIFGHIASRLSADISRDDTVDKVIRLTHL